MTVKNTTYKLPDNRVIVSGDKLRLKNDRQGIPQGTEGEVDGFYASGIRVWFYDEVDIFFAYDEWQRDLEICDPYYDEDEYSPLGVS